jgi:uncharacterized protein YaiE (UPF0345 family)
MFKVNEYFHGKVKSIAFQSEEGRATVGVIAPGEYEFGTVDPERMTVTSGAMDAKLPDKDWATFAAGQSFEVAGHARFQVRLTMEASYLCQYR